MRLDDLFVHQAKATPDAVALLHEGRTLSYAELDRRSNRLAHHLRAWGARADTVIAVCLPRTPDMVVALLAILKAGAAYLPLDPRHPQQRLAFMLRDSRAPLLLTQPPIHLRPEPPMHHLDLDAAASAIASQPSHRPAPEGSAKDLAYVIYTSGSTGAPKGVMLQHSVGCLIEWARRAYTPAELARVAATTSLGFDPSVYEIFMPLCLGGAVILKAHAFEPFRDDEAPTMLGCAPSVLARLARMHAIPDSVRVLNLGGEAVPGHLVEALYRASRVERIYNHYGPTEATISTTVALLPRGATSPTIGRPIPGVTVEILDGDGHPCPEGRAGEIHIAGPTLARGYLNRPDLTAERFVHRAGGPRLYRTGDLARWLPGGEIAFLGRGDDQVKRSGIRIEPGEVEAALQRLPGVNQAVVLVEHAAEGAPHLVAYIETSLALRAADVRRGLRAWLPDSMVPNACVFLERLPLTIAGKVDRVALAQAGVAARAHAKPAGPLPLAPGERMARVVDRAWCRALNHGRARPRPDQGWADAGGDSLRSLELLLRLERALGRRLAFDAISPDVTPRELTRRLLDDAAEAPGPPVFLIPGVLGDEPALAGFRRACGAAVRFDVIEPPELDRPGTVLRSLPESGRVLAREIARRQPDGPLMLGGYSFGAAAAYEAATTLQAAGRTIDLLLMLDAPLAELGASVLPDRAGWPGRLLFGLGQGDRRRRAVMAAVHPFGPLASARVRRPLLRRFRGAAMQAWRPEPLAVPGLVVLNRDAGPAWCARWRQLLPLARLVQLPAAHLDLFGPSSMAVLRPAILDAVLVAVRETSAPGMAD